MRGRYVGTQVIDADVDVKVNCRRRRFFCSARPFLGPDPDLDLGRRVSERDSTRQIGATPQLNTNAIVPQVAFKYR